MLAWHDTVISGLLRLGPFDVSLHGIVHAFLFALRGFLFLFSPETLDDSVETPLPIAIERDELGTRDNGNFGICLLIAIFFLGLFLGEDGSERNIIVRQELLYVFLLVLAEEDMDGDFIFLQGGKGFLGLSYQRQVAFIILRDDAGFMYID